METFIQIGIVGIALSFLVEAIKLRYGPKSGTTKGITLFLSAILGSLYYFANDTAWWQSFLGILATATFFYEYIIKLKK